MISVLDLSRRKVLPRIAWRKIAGRILGKKFDVSVVLVGERKMAEIKRKYSPIGYPRRPAYRTGRPVKIGATNVLSFLMDKTSGEIFLCPVFIGREAGLFGRNFQEHIFALYVHALLHLKGHDHQNKNEASRMEKEEKKWLKILW
ncbi:MAG: rRNA maturation RNase YbeY [Candidatus Niyogibacteria bacterium]|nr:rRNA maturation RNase YbeY [Candidatus Niyogibacteria bacterium]